MKSFLLSKSFLSEYFGGVWEDGWGHNQENCFEITKGCPMLDKIILSNEKMQRILGFFFDGGWGKVALAQRCL